MSNDHRVSVTYKGKRDKERDRARDRKKKRDEEIKRIGAQCRLDSVEGATVSSRSERRGGGLLPSPLRIATEKWFT